MPNKPQLFCFTYAGGTAGFFDEIAGDMPRVETVNLEYSGHGTRHRESFYNSFNELADDMFSCLKEAYGGGEYALLGYSMGSISAVEILRRIIESEMKLPSCVFLAAHEPHTKSELLDYKDDVFDEWVKERTIRFGAVPERLLNNSVFWRTYLPLYRADYTIIGKYEFEKLRLKTDISTVVFYSETDTPLTDMELWRNYFVGSCEFLGFEGQHFFIREHHKEMAEIITKRLGAENGI